MKSNLQNTKYQIQNTNRGITLVALIITVIVLLILAMVSIRLIMNGGIIDRAERGTTAYTEAEIKEKIGTAYSEYQLAKYQSGITFSQALANSGINVEESAVTGSDSEGYIVTYKGKDYPVSATGSVGDGIAQWKQNSDGSISKGETTGIQVGDTVKYETILAKSENAVDGDKLAQLKTDLQNYSGDSSSTDNANIDRDNLTWQVLDIKNGKIRLISSTPTTKKIRLKNYNGYNNAVYLIDKACDILYSVNEIGNAQNLKIEDIEEKINTEQFDYTKYINYENYKYGDINEYTAYLNYPNIYENEIGCKSVGNANITGKKLEMSEQTEPIDGKSIATNKLIMTQTYWYKSMLNIDFNKSIYYTLFINNGSNYTTYWLSSRCLCALSNNGDFSIRTVTGGSVKRDLLFSSTGDYWGMTWSFRPIVTLNLDVQLEPDGTNTWKIAE